MKSRFPLNNWLRTVDRDATVLVYLATGLATLFWIGIAFWKYYHFLYNALDLAIYTQVIWNTAHGRLFAMSIHPQLYLGDHFELYIVPLSLLFRVWQDPRTLLILQAIVVNTAALPLFFFARNIFQKSASLVYPRALALVVTLSFLVNPLVGNALVFEFHLLPFVILPLFLALYFAERQRVWATMLCLAATLLVREDAAFLVALFGLSAVLLFPSLRPQKWRWILPPFIVSVLWFVFSIWMVSRFSPTHDYKYFGFYSSLHGSLVDTILGLVQNPWPLINHLARWKHLAVAAGLFMTAGFTSLVAPTGLLLGFLPGLQFALTEADSQQILILHYGIVFVPAIMVASIFGLSQLATSAKLLHAARKRNLPDHVFLHIGLIFFIAGSLYSAVAFDQLRTTGQGAIFDTFDINREHSLRVAMATVKPEDHVVMTERLMPNAATREFVYPLGYVRRGEEQLSDAPYPVNSSIDAMLVSQEDLGTAAYNWKNAEVRFISLSRSARDLSDLVKKNNVVPIWSRDGIVIFRHASEGEAIPLVDDANQPNGQAGTKIAPGLFVTTDIKKTNENTLELTFHWTVTSAQDNRRLLIEEQNANNRTTARLPIDPTWGLSTTSQWVVGSSHTTHLVLTRDPQVRRFILSTLLPDETTDRHPERPHILVAAP